ncbi:MAG: cob(I)yrinic acid a,c-diamide adenosyltransferase [Thermoanaerobaculia bacterium]
MSRIYTRTGDDGTTGLIGGHRLPKDSLRIDAYGTVDELNSALGVALAGGLDPQIEEALTPVREQLFALGASLAVNEEDREQRGVAFLDPGLVARLEAAMDRLSESLPPLAAFILPGGSVGAAHLHLARTVCRRAERRVVTLARERGTDPTAVPYLNRLADLLFVAARYENHARGVADVPWSPSSAG